MKPYFVLLFFLLINLFLWRQTNAVTAQWGNVLPAPSENQSVLMSFGDRGLAYRTNALMLQNFGNVGGRSEALSEYNYEDLQEWFFLQDRLDHVSDAVPMMAAYYYGGVRDPEKLPFVLNYLEHVGQSPLKEKWRWLGHAVYLARHELKDLDRALELAYLLSENPNPDMASWARQMPVFVLEAKGDHDIAYDIMISILQTEGEKLHPNEVNFMVDFICNRLLGEKDEKPDFCQMIQ